MGETARMGRGRTIDRLRKQLHVCQTDNAQLHAKLTAWDRWEHSWIFGDEAPWPGHSGTQDPRVELEEMLRLVMGVPSD